MWVIGCHIVKTLQTYHFQRAIILQFKVVLQTQYINILVGFGLGMGQSSSGVISSTNGDLYWYRFVFLSFVVGKRLSSAAGRDWQCLQIYM